MDRRGEELMPLTVFAKGGQGEVERGNQLQRIHDRGKRKVYAEAKRRREYNIDHTREARELHIRRESGECFMPERSDALHLSRRSGIHEAALARHEALCGDAAKHEARLTPHEAKP